MIRLYVAVLLGAFSLWSNSDHCPVYSHPQFPPEFARSQQLSAGDELITRLSQAADEPRYVTGRNNFIDDFIFGKIEAAGIYPAPLTSDAEFLRRVSIDLTGRIPTPEEVDLFLGDPSPLSACREGISLTRTSAIS
jgi:hypothetical protein